MVYAAHREYDLSPEDFFDMLTDPDVIVGRFEDAGDRAVEIIRRGPHDDSFVVEWSRSAEADVPGFASRVLSPRNTIVQTDRWSAPDARGARSGTFAADVSGVPLRIEGVMSLDPTGSGCRYAVEGAMKVDIPLLGGRIARWAESVSGPRLEAELAYLATRTGP